MFIPVDLALDAIHTKRWALVATTVDSNVADHSFSVAMVAMAIRKKMFNTNHFSEEEVCYYAIFHDIREVLTGDIPTPVKARMKEKGMNPDELYGEIMQEKIPPPHIAEIIKLADLICNWFFISQHGSGARAGIAAAEVRTRLDDAIRGARPDLQRAASHTLDYIERRRSDDPEERKRLETEAKRLRDFTAFSRHPSPSLMGGKSLDSAGRS